MIKKRCETCKHSQEREKNEMLICKLQKGKLIIWKKKDGTTTYYNSDGKVIPEGPCTLKPSKYEKKEGGKKQFTNTT